MPSCNRCGRSVSAGHSHCYSCLPKKRSDSGKSTAGSRTSSGSRGKSLPRALPEFLNDPDAGKAEQAMQAMLKMKKIDIEGLKRAYEGQ